VKEGIFRQILETLARHLEKLARLVLGMLSDGTFVLEMGPKIGKTKRGKGMEARSSTAVYTSSASPHEVTLVEATLAEAITLGRPERLVGDRSYDSDPLDQKLAQMGIELIAPHKCNRNVLRHRTVVHYAGINAAGKLNACLPG
jgi:hypothetical protein